MKLSKLIKSFNYFLEKDKEENYTEINILIKKLEEKHENIKRKIINCKECEEKDKLKDKLKAVKKLIKKAKKEFI